METTEKIVESYCRYVKKYFTITNIKNGNKEIDILAVNCNRDKIEKYHIEVSISVSKNFSKLTSTEFDIEKLKQRVEKPKQRRTIGYFIHKKFNDPEIIQKLSEYNFIGENYKKVIVSWGWDKEVEKIANENKITLWNLSDILIEIENASKSNNSYQKDDILRTIQLFIKAKKDSTEHPH